MEGYLCRSGVDAPEMRWKEVFPERAACRHAQWCDKASGGYESTRVVEVMIGDVWRVFTVTASELIEYKATATTGGGQTP